MGFAAGSVSFRRLAVVGKSPKAIDQDILDRLEAHALRRQPGGEEEFGVPEEEEYGWNGGRHLFDATFSFEHNVFADALHFALRLDSNRPPADLKRAYQMMEEEVVAKGNPSGFISKLQKRDVKDAVRRKLEDELRAGHFRRGKLLPILWDLPTQTVYSPATGKALEKLLEIFERTFEVQLEPLSAGTIAERILTGRRRDYEDLRPTRFVKGPDGENQHPEYPWIAKGPQPKDFLGNEFLLWLWHEADRNNGGIKTEAGEVDIFCDRSLELDCAYGQSGKDSLRGTGPAQMPEARDGLRSGKVPRRAGLTLHAHKRQFDFTFAAEVFSFGTTKLPPVEDADTARTLFEERVALLRDLCQSVDGMFEAFLKVRAGAGWESQVSAIRKWIQQPMKGVAAVA